MPSTYAHRRFGTNVLEHLPDELRAQLEQNRELYDIGLHGPDLLFYYHAASSNPVSALGNAMHDKPGRVFFDRARGVVKAAGDRDAVLAYLEPQLQGVTDIGAAEQIIAGDLDGIARAAQTAAGERPVRVTLGAEHYPTRDYGTFALPAGVYTSLRVTLGAGEGHNWWCVIFPPLCAQAAGLSEQTVQALSDDDVRLVTESDGGYVVRFRLLELWDALVQRLS